MNRLNFELFPFDYLNQLQFENKCLVWAYNITCPFCQRKPRLSP